MSLKYDYFDGATGLLQQCDAAFAAGVAFVGTGAADIESLSLGDRDGSNLGAGSGQPGTYLDIAGPSGGFRLWISVAGEVAPASAGRTLAMVTILVGDTSAQAAAKIAAAIAALGNPDFSVQVIGNSLESTTTAPKAVSPLALSSGWGTASASVVQAGANPTGNYAEISNDLKDNAASGFTTFTLNYPATMSSALLRGANGSTSNAKVCTTNGTRSSMPNNLILKAYLAGIADGLAAQNLYSYEVTPALNISDLTDTSIDLNFHFQSA